MTAVTAEVVVIGHIHEPFLSISIDMDRPTERKVRSNKIYPRRSNRIQTMKCLEMVNRF
jgi:rRNA processing protein Gar1